MDALPSAINFCFQPDSILCRTTEFPTKFIGISFFLLQISELVFLSLVPEHRFAKDQPERHFVDQCFQGAWT